MLCTTSLRCCSGLAAYMSWLPTLQLLLEQMQAAGGGDSSGSGAAHSDRERHAAAGAAAAGPLVCCFTDYNEEAVHRSRKLLDYLLASQVDGSGTGGSGGGGSGAAVADSEAAPAGAARGGTALCGGSASGGGGGQARCTGGPAGRVIAVEAGMHSWRKAAAVLASDHALPSASNGFALWLTRQDSG